MVTIVHPRRGPILRVGTGAGPDAVSAAAAWTVSRKEPTASAPRSAASASAWACSSRVT